MSGNDIPPVVECPECGRMVGTVRERYVRHASYQVGPACPASGQEVTVEAVEASRNVERARTVLHWAERLRDEDPALVHGWLADFNRTELEALLCVALAAIRPDQTLSEAFGWVGQPFDRYEVG